MNFLKGILIVGFVLLSCSHNEDPTSFCESYCNDWLIAYDNYAEGHNCSVNNAGAYKDRCEESCYDAYYAADEDLAWSIEGCTECIHEDLPDGFRQKDFDTSMRGNCQANCSTLGCQQFFGTFFVTDPEIICE